MEKQALISLQATDFPTSRKRRTSHLLMNSDAAIVYHPTEWVGGGLGAKLNVPLILRPSGDPHLEIPTRQWCGGPCHYVLYGD